MPIAICQEDYDELKRQLEQAERDGEEMAAEIARQKAGWSQAFNIGVAKQEENERLRTAVSKGEYLAQAAGRAMRDHGGAEKFLDLNAAVAEFRRASGTGPA